MDAANASFYIVLCSFFVFYVFSFKEESLGVGATGLNMAIRPPRFRLLAFCCTQSINTRNATVLSPFGPLVFRLLPVAGFNVTTTTLFKTTPCALFHNHAFVDIMVAASMPYQRGEPLSLGHCEDTWWLTAKTDQESPTNLPDAPGHYRDHTDRANCV